MVPSLLDRYVVRETLLPFLLSLLLITFLLIIPPMLQQGYALIAQGVGWSVVVRVLVTLLPQALSISIPMAVLMGLLIAFGRLSADREFVAMQACGVSVYRLLRPVAFIALVSTAATGYVLIVSLPNANQRFREITLREVSSLVENNVKPRVFFDKFPNRVLYVRDLPPGGGWRDIFLADSSKPGETTVYFRARRTDPRRSREADGAAAADARHPAHDDGRAARRVPRDRLRALQPEPGSADRVSAAAQPRRAGNDDRRSAPHHRARRTATTTSCSATTRGS